MKKTSPITTLQKSAALSLRRLSQTPGASWKKFSHGFQRSRKDGLKEFTTWQRSYLRTLQWQYKNFFVTYQATLWRRIALLTTTIALAAVAGMILMYFRFTPRRPLVTIGNRVVVRGEYMAKLDSVAGKPVLTKIVFTELVRQAAAKAKVTPTPAQIDKRIDEMRRHGQQIPTDIALQPFRDDLAVSMALENLRIIGISASDAEVAALYRNNLTKLTEPAEVQSILVVTPSAFAAQQASAMLSKNKTATEIAAQPDMHVDGENGYHIDLSHLPRALHEKVIKTALNMLPGQITSLPVGDSFLVVKCLQKTQAHLPSFPEIKEELAHVVRLQKAPSDSIEMAKLYQANKPNFDMDRYAAYFSDIANAQIPPTPSAPKTASAP